MKVLYILNSANIFGGSTKSFLRYIFPLLESHDDIEAIICAPQKMKEWVISNKNIKFYEIAPRFYIYPSTRTFKDILLFVPKIVTKIIRNYFDYQKILKIARKEKIDMIHTNVSVINIGFLAAKKLGIPHIYHIREFQTSDFGMKIIPSFSKFTSNLQRRGNFNICITRAIQHHFGLNEKNSKVIYNGVKSMSFIPNTEKKQPYFLFVGRLEESKGIEEVIKAFGKASLPNAYKLLIAGDTANLAYKEKLFNISKNLGKEEQVHFLGNRKDIDLLMQEATAIIIASTREAFGLITAEAAFNKCLIIGKNTGGTAEQIENGLIYKGKESGLKYNSFDELCKILCDVAYDPLSYQYVTDSAYETAKEIYTIDSCVNAIYGFYQNILNYRA